MTDAIEHLLSLAPYVTDGAQKEAALLAAMGQALRHHAGSCPPYRRFLERRGFDVEAALTSLADIPFLPAPIFKTMTLTSASTDKVVRTISSSGTSSQIPSRVAIDNLTRTRQMKALASQLREVIGPERRPFLVMDVAPKAVATGNPELSARIAGMRGYLMAASEVIYLLDDDSGAPKLAVKRLREAVQTLAGERKPFCVLAYTYILYQHVIAPLLAQSGAVDLPAEALILHFGGWKKLADKAVSREVFSEHAGAVFGLPPQRILDIYGFTEQLGVIYPDDGFGIKRCPVFSEVLVRDPVTLKVMNDGESGFLEFITPLPHSYPGVAVLLDDIGRVVTRRPGPDGRRGTGFEVLGRAAGAEVRGCGDTLPNRVYEVAG
jgi:hypothetical protein